MYKVYLIYRIYPSNHITEYLLGYGFFYCSVIQGRGRGAVLEKVVERFVFPDDVLGV